MEPTVNQLSADRLEHFQWLNSPVTRKLRECIDRELIQQSKYAESASLTGAVDNETIRACLTRSWMCRKILDLIVNLPDVGHETK